MTDDQIIAKVRAAADYITHRIPGTCFCLSCVAARAALAMVEQWEAAREWVDRYATLANDPDQLEWLRSRFTGQHMAWASVADSILSALRRAVGE